MVSVKIFLFLILISMPFFFILSALFYQVGGTIYLSFLVVTTFGLWLWGDKLLLKLVRIRIQGECRSGVFYDLVSNVSYKLGVPTPRIHFYRGKIVNTFILKGPFRSSSIYILHENLLDLFSLEEIEVITYRELLKIKDKSIFPITFETLVLTLIISGLKKVGNPEDKKYELKFQKGPKIIKIGGKFRPFFRMLFYSFAFFYAYLITKILNTNKSSLKKDQLLLKKIKDKESFAVILEKLIKINKGVIEKEFIGRNYFINGQGEYFQAFHQFFPSVADRYQAGQSLK